MLTTQQPAVQAVPGFDFLSCQARGPFHETWTARDPNGELWRIQFVHGFANLGRHELTDSLRRLLALRHPALLKLDVLHESDHQLVFGSDWVEASAVHRFNVCRARGLPGIPRAELLGYLGAVAEVVDALAERHQLQHLGLNPHALLLDAEDEARLADFGVAQLLWLRAGHSLGRLNKRYAAPELFVKGPGPHCDQYSLAVICAELLTGQHPFARSRLGQREHDPFSALPDLELLSSEDRTVLARALHHDPRRRFGKCTDLVRALREVRTGLTRAWPPEPKRGLLPAVLSLTNSATADPLAPRRSSTEIIQGLLAGAARLNASPGDDGGLPYELKSGQALRYSCVARWPAGLGRLKLHQFAEYWNAIPVQEEEGLLVLELPSSGTLWQRWRGQQPGLRIALHLRPIPDRVHALVALRVEITPVGGNAAQASHLLEQCGPVLLQSLRNYLYFPPERRQRDRVRFAQPLQVFPVEENDRLGEVLVGQGKDLSPSGMGLLLPVRPATPRIYIHSALTSDSGGVAILGNIVRVHTGADGWFEAGAMFSTKQRP